MDEELQQYISYLDMSAFGNFIKFNVEIARVIWIDATIVLSEIYSEFKYFAETSQLENGWFFLMVDKLEQKTTLTRYQQNKAMNTLQEMKLIEFKNKWIPPKRRIKLNINELIYQFSPQRLKNFTYIGKKIWPSSILDNIDNNISASVQKDNGNLNNWKEFIWLAFANFWSVYPKHKWKQKAFEIFARLIQWGQNSDLIIKKAKEYAEEVKKKWTEDKYIKRPQGWLNEKRFLDWDDILPELTRETLDINSLSRDNKQRYKQIMEIEDIEEREKKLNIFIDKLNRGIY